ncbi:MAG: hypothetical protein M3Q42_04430 [Pseudomonadota bacterium]|nr:hypothetical protein [Pseudomonadota bacterium]
MSPHQQRPANEAQPQRTSAAQQEALSRRQTHPGERRVHSDRRVCFDRRDMIRFDADRRQLFDRREDVEFPVPGIE